MHGDDVGTGWMIVMTTLMVLFWGAVILGIVWLVRGAAYGWRERRGETPTAILERRFAEGAISIDEYWERRNLLETGIRRGRGPGRADSSQASGTSESERAQP